MNSLDALIRAWMGHAWHLSLVVTLALGIVVLLRVPCRRWFGAERAFQLWALVPLVLLLAAWPRAPGVGASSLPPVLLRIVTAPVGMSAPALEASRFDWRGPLVLGWVVGVLWTLVFATIAQARFRRRLTGAQLMSAPGARLLVWRAGDADLGPALVGLWRSRIIVPVDFDTRYEPAEQALILAHEAMHARRGDVWWSLAAQLVAGVFWFLPFRGWALERFRRDQELACDAAVLREHPARRRSYAHAMLKTQSCRWTLPVGCLWSSRHPVTERIAMLKQPQPRIIRRLFGLATLIALSLGTVQLVLAAGAAGQPGATDPAANFAAPRPAGGFTLRLTASADGEPVRLRSTSCYKDGDFYTLTEGAAGGLPSWNARITVVPAEHGQLEVRAYLSGGSLAKPVSPRIRMRPGQPGGIQLGEVVMGKDGRSIDHTLKLELTTWPGCVKPAEDAASGDVRFHFAISSARDVAQSIAQRAGLTIENPESLNNVQPVEGNFEGAPAPEALRLVGNLGGMTPVFDGKRVRFQAK